MRKEKRDARFRPGPFHLRELSMPEATLAAWWIRLTRQGHD
jgi:hypothetical protein